MTIEIVLKSMMQNAQYTATTPKAISAQILEFCNQLVEGAAPERIEITPQPFARVAHCYGNVEEMKHRVGGEAMLGWTIWELEGVYLTAEHHAVLFLDGKLVDVTPQRDSETEILFLRDEVFPYERTNRYFPLGKSNYTNQICELLRRNCFLGMCGMFTNEALKNDKKATRLIAKVLGHK